jgi:hypothetical protein
VRHTGGIALAAGVDVSARHGLDIVVLDQRRVLAHPPPSRQGLAQLCGLLQELRPDVVAIDSPPQFAAAGSSRECERELARRGMHCYFTPSEQAASGNRFYDWMRQGHRVFALAAEAGYPLYRPGQPVRGTAIEVFPHASAVVLRGSLSPSACSKNRR